MQNYYFILGIFKNLDLLLVILARVLGFIIILPAFSNRNIPNIAKIGFASILSIIIYTNSSFSYSISSDTDFVQFSLILIKEFLSGFIMAFSVYAVFSIIYIVGQLIDQSIGFSMINVLDVTSQLQVPITGNLIYMAIISMLIITGGINYLILAFVKSFEVIPINKEMIINNDSIVQHILSLIANYFVFGAQIALPIVGTILLIDVALGLLVKAVPQMNVFVVGMPFKLFIGVLLLYVVSPMFSGVYTILFENAYEAILKTIRSLY